MGISSSTKERAERTWEYHRVLQCVDMNENHATLQLSAHTSFDHGKIALMLRFLQPASGADAGQVCCHLRALAFSEVFSDLASWTPPGVSKTMLFT